MALRGDFAASVRSGLLAGAVCGLAFGLADGVVAAAVLGRPLGAGSLLGCLAAAVLEYSVLWMAGLALLGALLHALRQGGSGGRLTARLLHVGLSIGIFAEIYWWTRPLVFYGHAATSPERLAAAAGILAVAAACGWALTRIAARAPDAIWKAGAVALAAGWIGGAAYLVLQRNAVGSRGEVNDRNRDLPNVVLVIVDAMRQDMLGCYGDVRMKTPHVDRLAREGVVFENAFTQAPFTWSSFGSILTGKYPRRHGLMRMKAGLRMPDNVTLPMLLKDRDVLTATFHTGTLTDASGLLGGFDLRFEATAGHDLVVLDRPWSVYRANLLLAIARNKLSQHLDLGGTAAEARRFVAGHGDRRFFAMVHLYSTHTPYDPPEEFRRMYCDPKYTGPVKAFWAEHRKMIEDDLYQPTHADEEQIRDLYRAGVSQADAQIGELLDEIARAGALDDTLVVVTADHGESLGEQGPGGVKLWEHDHMVQTNLRIPLVMRWPKGLPAGRRVAGIVDEIDILPTVCELAGIAAPPGIDGASLVPLVRAEKESVREFSIAENGLHVAIQDKRWKLVVPLVALSGENGWKDALAGRPEAPRLYDLPRDPEEKFNQVRKEPLEAERLFARLRDWNDKLPIPADSIVPSARDLENQKRLLERLGYAGGDEERARPQ